MKLLIAGFWSVLLGAGFLVGPASTQAATITVTSAADNGPGTLRAALTNVVNGDTINFSITGTITLTNGELLVTNNVTILGPGPANLAVNGNGNSRVFHIQNGANATIASLTITNGKALGDVGGGIHNDHSTLTVSNCTLGGNSARFAGGIYNNGIGGSAGLSVISSTIISNSVGIAGGGIYNNAIGGSATLTVLKSTFIGNSTASNGNGAGIYNDGTSGGSAILTVSKSTFSGNAAYFGSGGGIYNHAGTVTVSISTLSGNLAYSPGGGGIYNVGIATLTVTDSILSGNSAGSGGGILNDGSSGGRAMLSVFTSTFTGNVASANGGGISNDGILGTVTGLVATCTFSTNSASNGGGISNDGAGSSNATLRVNACTFSGNSASVGGGGCSIYNDASSGGNATVEIGDTILVRGATGSNFTNTLGTVISDGYNLSSDGGGGFLIATGDQIHTNAMLGPLQNNGGPTLTHALPLASPAVDQGRRDAIPSLALTTDQRGGLRPFDLSTVTNASGGDGSDIGAFEVVRPTLSIQQAGSNAVLSWPFALGGFTLESSTNVALSNSWVTASGSAFAAGSLYLQTNGPISTNRFFRLRGN